MENLKVGIQLYSVRDEMEKDVYAALEKVKAAGYDYVEFAGFYDLEVAETKKMLEEIGLTAISVHQTVDGFLEKSDYWLDYYKTLGIKYVTLPSLRKQDLLIDSETYNENLEKVTKMAKLLKTIDATLSYHNHEFEFQKTGDKYILDNLYDALSPEILQTQLDLCWVKYGGEDPVKYVNKYSDRCPTIHFKDFTCKKLNAGAAYALIDDSGNAVNQRSVDEFKYKPLGDGMQDFAPIVEAVKKSVAEYVIIEQDGGFQEMSSIDSVTRSRKFLKDTFNM